MTDQQHSRQRHHSRQRKDPGGTDQRAELPSFPHDSLCSNVSRTGRIIAIFRCFWLILIQNRVAIAIASLLWLLYRTGTQPRRIIYPCQQVAAVNVTVAFKGLIPALFLVRKRRCPHAANRDSLTKRQLLIAVFLFVAAFLGLEAYHFAIHAMPVALPAAPPRPGNPMPTTIAIVQAEQTPISNAEVEAMVQRAVAQAGGLEEIIEPGDSVVLKVNLVEDGWSPGDGVTTDPRVTRAVVRLAQAAGAETVAIVEGSARGRDGYFGRDVTRYAFHDSGYDSDWDMIDDETGVQLFDLNDAGGIDQHDPDKVTLVTIPNGLVRTQYYVPNVLLNCDVLVSIPTFKNHSATGITLSLKNRVGCAPSDIYHAPFAPYDNQMKWGVVHSVDSGFPRNVSGEYPVPPPTSDEKLLAHYATVDLNLVRPQDFVVVDGLVGITRGPVGHDQASPPMGLVLAGEDSVAVDTVATLVMNYDPAYVEHIAWANQRELGTMETSVITVLGDHVATVRRDFPLDHGGAGITVRADASPPWIGKISLTDGETVCGDATIEGSEFGDDRGVVKAELLVDGEFVAAISNPSDPFTFVWDSTSVPAGEHEVAVTVYDAAFNEGSINCIVTTVGPCWSPDFHYSVIDSNNSGRVAIGEINGDGFNDVVVHRWGSNYGTGGDGSLTWYDGYENYDRSYDWQQTVIDSNGNFYGDDVIIADVNGDAYNDIVCCKEDHGTRLWWYEHPGVGHNPAVDPWAQHEFGQAGYSEEIKDIEVVDIDSDGKLDAIVRQKAGVTIWFQDDLDDVGNEWTVKTIDIKPQGREGMTVGDVDMDAHPDIVLNGYWVRNPHATGNARTDAWSEYSIHSIWYDQDTGQWWDNAVKTLVVDVNGDGANDVVFSHSEAFIETFPIAWYELNDYTLGDSGWTQHIILPSIRNCHTLQAGDMDNDGHNDIVAGQLRGEGQYPLYVLYNGGGVVPTWEQQTIDADIGCYNGEVGDIGNDGDLDFVSSKTWEVGPIYIYENQLDSGPSVLPPIIAPPADDVANPGIPYSRTPASTQGTPPISWSLVVGPPGMTIDPGTGEVSWPDPQPAGSAHPVTIGASNSAGSDEASWTLGVAEFEPVPPVENVVVNPSFQDGKSPWKFYTNGTGSFEVTSSAYDGTAAAHVTTVTGGTNIQLFQHDLPLEPNTEYQLSFVAYSNTGHDFSVSMVKHDPPYTNYGLTSHKVNLTTSWNTYSINFTTKNFSSPVNDARLVFWFASDAATGDQYWIDNVALFQVGVTFQYDLTASVVGGNGTISPTSGTYDEGTVVTLTATPDAGYRILAWIGTDNDALTENTNTVTMDGPKTVTVEFELIPATQYTLTMAVSGNGSTTPPVGDHNYAEGEVITISAVPDSGWQFDIWTGDVADPNLATTTVNMDTDKTVTATFTQSDVIYTENFEDYAAGADPVDWLDTAADNSMLEDDSLFKVFELSGNKVFGTTSTLANIHTHYMGAGVDTLSSYEYTGRMRMTTAGSGIGVTFFSQYPQADAYYRLRRHMDNSFHIAPHGTSITGGTTDTGVVPIANVWYHFRIQVEDTGTRTEIRARVWQDGTSEPLVWQMDAYDDSATRLTAGKTGVWSFTSGSKYWDDLTVNSGSPPATQHDLTASVTGGNGTVSPTSGAYDEGTVVTLTATPDAGYRVLAWIGTDNDALTENTNTVTMDGPKTVTVEFELIPATQHDLTASVVGGNGTISPMSGTYNEGTAVTLTASPDADYRVSAWTGTDDDTLTSNTNTVTMDGDKTVTVKFEEIPSVKNVIVNPGFEDGKSPWKFYTNGEGSFEISSSVYEGAGAARITTTTIGTNIQFFQHDLPLEPNTEYDLSFAAYSNTGHDLRVTLCQHGPPYNNYGLAKQIVNLTTSWDTYSINFTTKNFSSPVNDSRLSFWLATDSKDGDQYWIDEVVLQAR